MKTKRELEKLFRNYVKETEGEKAFKLWSGSSCEAICINFVKSIGSDYVKKADVIEYLKENKPYGATEYKNFIEDLSDWLNNLELPKGNS